jgi:hypothetical protein
VGRLCWSLWSQCKAQAGKPLVFQDGLGQQSASFGAIAVAYVDKRTKRSVTVGCALWCEVSGDW